MLNYFLYIYNQNFKIESDLTVKNINKLQNILFLFEPIFY